MKKSGFPLLLISIQLLPACALCPAPFSLEAGKCVFVNTSQSFSWCDANRQCASIGGELLNSYSSLQLLDSMPSLNCSCKLWFGLTDLADERNKSRSGWQMINGNGILPLNNSMWFTTMPNNNGNQDCLSQLSINVRFIDLVCSSTRGFVCEFAEPSPLKPYIAATWTKTNFKREDYNPSTEYCFSDLMQTETVMHCVKAATASGSCKHVLYNSKMRICRMVLFTDAQVEKEIETSADWVKYKIVRAN